MQSSGNKFFFDVNSFDDDVIDEDEVIEEDLPPPPPTFSEAELEAAKQEAYSQGHQDGTKEAQAARSQIVAQTLEKLVVKTEALFAQEGMREKAYEREVISLCLSIFEKTFPTLHQKHGFDELEAQLAKIIQGQQGQNAIKVHVSPAYEEGIAAFMQRISDKNDELSFNVSGDESLRDGDVSVKWDNGGAIYKTQQIADRIQQQLQEALAGLGTNSHDEKSNDSQDLAVTEGVAAPENEHENLDAKELDISVAPEGEPEQNLEDKE